MSRHSPSLFAKLSSARRPWGYALLSLVFFGLLWLFFGRGVTGDKEVVQDDGAPPPVYAPISYDVANWQARQTLTAPFDSTALIATLGATNADTGLDYYGKEAMVYRYHNRAEIPFFVVQSQDLLELSWYFADPKDDTATKAQSLSYAKKAYGLSYELLGEQALPLFTQLLQSATINELPKNVLTAKCADYRCQLVFQLAKKK